MTAPSERITSRIGFGRTLPLVGVACGTLLILAAFGCNQRSAKEPVKTQPSGERGLSDSAPQPPASAPRPLPETRPTALPPTQTQPSAVERPAKPPATASKPSRPESTYSSVPPYPVSLYVESPDDKQPGWLRIEKFTDDNTMATAKGRFPEQNRIYVDTNNVRTIRIHVGHLPLRPNERVILQIDKQGMVISRKNPFVTLTRQPTGEWVPEKEK